MDSSGRLAFTPVRELEALRNHTRTATLRAASMRCGDTLPFGEVCCFSNASSLITSLHVQNAER